MRILKALTILGLASAWTSSALAGAGTVNTAVTSLQENTTYSSGGSKPLTTYVAYTVTISNDGGNTVNNIYFTARTSVTDAAEKAIFSSADGASCVTTNADKTAIQCTIGNRQLKAGQATPVVALFFLAPTKVTNGTADDEGTDKVSLTGQTLYAETTGGPTSPPQNSVKDWVPPADVVLGTNNPTLVRSAVPKTGATLFTGDGAAATGGANGDKWTSTVVIPATATYTIAEIEELPPGLPLASNLLDSNTTKLTIPGSFAKLVITLRRDVSTIANGAKISSAIIYYTEPAHPDSRINYTGLGFVVPPCSDTTYGPLPQPGIPCISGRTEYTKKNAPTADWVGDWEFQIQASDNGRYTN